MTHSVCSKRSDHTHAAITNFPHFRTPHLSFRTVFWLAHFVLVKEKTLRKEQKPFSFLRAFKQRNFHVLRHSVLYFSSHPGKSRQKNRSEPRKKPTSRMSLHSFRESTRIHCTFALLLFLFMHSTLNVAYLSQIKYQRLQFISDLVFTQSYPKQTINNTFHERTYFSTTTRIF